MEKLLKLLQEFEKETEKKEGYPIYNWSILNDETFVAEDDFYWTKFEGWEAQDIICSQRYGFIKWLVGDHANEIDWNKIKCPMVVVDWEPCFWPFNAIDVLLLFHKMDKIEFLISILK